MKVAARMRDKLANAFSPAILDIVDESHLHAGHVGARPEGETHFRITIVATAFEGQSRVQRQRAVNKVLAEELAGPVHALAMRALTPAEAEKS